MSARDGETVVSNELGEVRSCGCGGVNLTVGAVTLHLAAAEFRDLHGLVSASLGMVNDHPPRTDARRRRSAPRLVH